MFILCKYSVRKNHFQILVQQKTNLNIIDVNYKVNIEDWLKKKLQNE